MEDPRSRQKERGHTWTERCRLGLPRWITNAIGTGLLAMLGAVLAFTWNASAKYTRMEDDLAELKNKPTPMAAETRGKFVEIERWQKVREEEFKELRTDVTRIERETMRNSAKLDALLEEIRKRP